MRISSKILIAAVLVNTVSFNNQLYCTEKIYKSQSHIEKGNKYNKKYDRNKLRDETYGTSDDEYNDEYNDDYDDEYYDDDSFEFENDYNSSKNLRSNNTWSKNNKYDRNKLVNKINKTNNVTTKMKKNNNIFNKNSDTSNIKLNKYDLSNLANQISLINNNNKFCEFLLEKHGDKLNLEFLLQNNTDNELQHSSEMLSHGEAQTYLLKLLKNNDNYENIILNIVNNNKNRPKNTNAYGIITRLNYILLMKKLDIDISFEDIYNKYKSEGKKDLITKFFENLFGINGKNLKDVLLSCNIKDELECIDKMISSHKEDLISFLRCDAKLFNNIFNVINSTKFSLEHNNIINNIKNCINYIIVITSFNFGGLDKISDNYCYNNEDLDQKKLNEELKKKETYEKRMQAFFNFLFENHCDNFKTILSYDVEQDLKKIENFLQDDAVQKYFIDLFRLKDENEVNTILNIVDSIKTESYYGNEIIYYIKYCINHSILMRLLNMDISFKEMWENYFKAKNDDNDDDQNTQIEQFCNCLLKINDNNSNLYRILFYEGEIKDELFKIINYFLHEYNVKKRLISKLEENIGLYNNISGIVNNFLQPYDTSLYEDNNVNTIFDKIKSCIFLKTLGITDVNSFISNIYNSSEEFYKFLFGNKGENLKTVLIWDCRASHIISTIGLGHTPSQSFINFIKNNIGCINNLPTEYKDYICSRSAYILDPQYYLTLNNLPSDIIIYNKYASDIINTINECISNIRFESDWYS